MASNMWWFFDLIIIMLIAGFVFIGYTRTLGKTLILLVNYLMAFSVALIADSLVADYIYQSRIKSNLISKSETTISSYKAGEDIEKILEASFPGISLEMSEVNGVITAGGSDIVDRFTSLIAEKNNVYKDITSLEVNYAILSGYENTLFDTLKENVPSFAVKELYSKLSSDNAMLSDVIKSATFKSITVDDEEMSAGEYLEKNSFSHSILSLIRIVVFLTVFFLLLALARIISVSLQRFESFDIDKKPSMSIAVAFSVIEALALAVIVAIAVKGTILASDEELIFLNDSTVGKTMIFKYIYNLNIV